MQNSITLKNGVRFVYEKIENLRSVSIGLWVENGSRNENEINSGVSHFIEHMLFKGTENRTYKVIAEEMDEIGGQVNAFTGKEYTCYYTRTITEHFEKAVDILADMFFNSLFKNNEIEKERNVILEEINMYEDSPEDLVHEQLQREIFKNNSLSYSILGTEKSLDNFNHDFLIDYLEKNYHPKNLVISVAGNFNEAFVIKTIEKYFENFKRDTDYISSIEKPVYKKSLVVKAKDIEQLHLVQSFLGIGVEDENKYSVSVLNNIFGGSMSSLLFQKIREEHGLSYTIYSYTNRYKGIGTFSIYSGSNKDQGEKIINLTKIEINNFLKNKISNEFLLKTKTKLKTEFLLGLDSTNRTMNNLGKNMILFNKIVSPKEVLKELENVTLNSLYLEAEKIFNFDNFSLSAVGNIKNINFERIINNG